MGDSLMKRNTFNLLRAGISEMYPKWGEQRIKSLDVDSRSRSINRFNSPYDAYMEVPYKDGDKDTKLGLLDSYTSGKKREKRKPNKM